MLAKGETLSGYHSGDSKSEDKMISWMIFFLKSFGSLKICFTFAKRFAENGAFLKCSHSGELIVLGVITKQKKRSLRYIS